MTDSEVDKLDQLLQNMAQFRKEVHDSAARLDERVSETNKHLSKTNERLTQQSKWSREGDDRIAGRLDLVAAHLARLDDDVIEVKEIVSGHSEDLDTLQRRLEKDLDRLDDHGKHIDILDAKTAHLPTPPTR
jgi:septation ring formation regulator EzrA